MGTPIRHRESPEDAVRRVAMSEVRSSIDNLRIRQPTTHEAVHECCKRLRGLIRLVRQQLGKRYRPENRFYRNLSRELSSVRDSQALIEAVDRLSAHFGSHEAPLPDLSVIRDYLVHSRNHTNGGHQTLLPQLDAITEQLQEANHRIDKWLFTNQGFDCFRGGSAQLPGCSTRNAAMPPSPNTRQLP